MLKKAIFSSFFHFFLFFSPVRANNDKQMPHDMSWSVTFSVKHDSKEKNVAMVTNSPYIRTQKLKKATLHLIFTVFWFKRTKIKASQKQLNMLLHDHCVNYLLGEQKVFFCSVSDQLGFCRGQCCSWPWSAAVFSLILALKTVSFHVE